MRRSRCLSSARGRTMRGCAAKRALQTPHRPRLSGFLRLAKLFEKTKKLRQTVCMQPGEIIVQRHADRRIAATDEKCLAPVIPAGIGPRQNAGAVRDVFALIVPDAQAASPVIGRDGFQMEQQAAPPLAFCSSIYKNTAHPLGCAVCQRKIIHKKTPEELTFRTKADRM